MLKRYSIWRASAVLATLATLTLIMFSAAATAETSASLEEYDKVPVCFGYEINADGARSAQEPGAPQGCFPSRAAAAKVYGKAKVLTYFTFGEAWDQPGFWGNKLTLVVADNQAYCGDRRTWGWSWLDNWNDRIRSIKSYGVCSAQMFQDINFQPINDFYVCGRECGALPWSWSAAVSSLKLKVF